jgi:hypothetical protein
MSEEAKKLPPITGTGNLRAGVATSAPARRTRAARKPTLASAIKQAKKAGLNVRSATIAADGVSLLFGEPQAEPINPWLDEIERMTKQ